MNRYGTLIIFFQLTIEFYQDRANGISPGFGATINIINGGVECNTRDGEESKQARNRIEYYKQFAWYLYVDYEDEELGCAKQKQFSAGIVIRSHI